MNLCIISQPIYDVRTTLYGRWNDGKMLKRHRNNVLLTACLGWDIFLKMRTIRWACQWLIKEITDTSAANCMIIYIKSSYLMILYFWHDTYFWLIFSVYLGYYKKLESILWFLRGVLLQWLIIIIKCRLKWACHFFFRNSIPNEIRWFLSILDILVEIMNYIATNLAGNAIQLISPHKFLNRSIHYQNITPF